MDPCSVSFYCILLFDKIFNVDYEFSCRFKNINYSISFQQGHCKALAAGQQQLGQLN